MKYDISIVTPFCNIDMDIFKNCIASMKNQTFGFKNIQWMVVIHNSDKEYEDSVHRLLDAYENVLVLELHNDKNTPSSPRNYGMKFAEGEYIGFLDGDDSFLPYCIEKVLRYAKQEKPQIVWFRREVELESKDSIPLIEVVLWNQMREKIVITKDNWQNEKMFTGLCGMVTSRIYNRQFLQDIGLQFDETVPLAEDFLFNLEAYGHADKILYLPQLIGYHYFINSSSLVQSSKKTGKILIEYAKGYKKVFDTGLKYGFYMNYIISFLNFHLSRFMIDNDTITLEERKIIRDILKPYIELTKPLSINKIVNEKTAEDFYTIQRDVILNPEKWDDPDSQIALNQYDYGNDFHTNGVEDTLFDILRCNSDTDIGDLYGFSDINSVDDFQNKVPVSFYETYEILMHLTTRVGESGIFVSEPISYYSVMWGSVGNKILFPQTQRQIDTFGKILEDTIGEKISFIMAESMPRFFRYNDGIVMNSVWGIILSSYLAKKNLYSVKSVFTSPQELLFPEKPTDTLYLRLLFAMAEPDVEQIIAPSIWNVLVALDFLKHNHKALCDDIENGYIGSKCNADEEIKECLNKKLNSSPERANYLRNVFKDGFDGHTLKRIWPKLTRIIAECTSSFALYKKRLDKYTSDIKVENGYLVRDVGIIGKPIDRSGRYELLTKNAFYEFADVNGTIHTIRELKENSEYELIITNRSGLYRSHTNEMIRVCSANNDNVIFSSLRVGNYGIKLGDTLLSEDKILNAVLALEAEKGIEVADFTFADLSTLTADNSIQPVIILQASSDLNSERKLRETAIDEITEILNSYLMDNVPNYREYVESGKLDLSVRIGHPETNFMYCELQRYKNDLIQDQVKPLKYLDNPRKIRFYLNSCF